MQRNNQLEESLNDNSDDKMYNEKAEDLSEQYKKISLQVKAMQKKEKGLLCEINDILTEQENLSTGERRALEDVRREVMKQK